METGIKVHVLDCGSTTIDEALPFSNRSRNPLAFTGVGGGAKHKVTVPVRAYLVEHPSALILVDTGWDTTIRENARKYEGFANYFASPGQLPAGQAVTEHLERLGYRASDIDYCILTHMDIDHAGGIGLVCDAKHVMASQAEYAAAQKGCFRYLRRLWQGIRIEAFPNAQVDLLGDGTVTLMPLHGHSAGMTAVKVGAGEYVVIAGDAGYGRESWEKLVLPGIAWNKAAALASLKRLRRFAQDDNCLAVLMTHDLEQGKEIYGL